MVEDFIISHHEEAVEQLLLAPSPKEEGEYDPQESTNVKMLLITDISSPGLRQALQTSPLQK